MNEQNIERELQTILCNSRCPCVSLENVSISNEPCSTWTPIWVHVQTVAVDEEAKKIVFKIEIGGKRVYESMAENAANHISRIFSVHEPEKFFFEIGDDLQVAVNAVQRERRMSDGVLWVINIEFVIL